MDADERREIVKELAGKHFLSSKPAAGRANTSGQRHQILSWIGILWEQNPDMRLGQLICNGLQFEGSSEFSSKLFYIEDYPLLDELREHYGHTETF